MLSSKLQRKAPESEENPRKLVAHNQIPGLHIPAPKPRRAKRREAEKARLMRNKVTLSKKRTNRDQELQLAQVRKVEMWATKWRLNGFDPDKGNLFQKAISRSEHTKKLVPPREESVLFLRGDFTLFMNKNFQI